MFRKITLSVLTPVILLLSLTLVACTPSSPLTQKSPLTILGTLAEPGIGEVTAAHVVLSRGKHVVEEVVPVTQNEFQAVMQIPIGQWELTVLLVDSEGIVHFQNKPLTTEVTMKVSNLVELVLRPADRQVHVSIDLEHYIFKDLAMRARIHFDDVIHEVIRPDTKTPLEAEISLSPGSYEFKVELYTESFRIGDRLGPGIWEVIHLAENEDISIMWSPVTETLQIIGRMETILPAPSNLLLSDTGDGVLIVWDPLPHPELTGYFLFAQDSPLERFELLSPVPLQEPCYEHYFDLEEPPTEINYVVAGVSLNGHVGYYSDPQTWRR